MNALLSEKLAISSYQNSVAGPTDIAWVPIEGFSTFLAIVVRTVGVAGLDDFRILGNPELNGSGTDVVLADYANVGTPGDVDAVGDQATLEIDQSVLDANPDVRAISVSLGHAAASNNSAITYIRAGARFQHGGLTPQDVIS